MAEGTGLLAQLVFRIARRVRRFPPITKSMRQQLLREIMVLNNMQIMFEYLDAHRSDAGVRNFIDYDIDATYNQMVATADMYDLYQLSFFRQLQFRLLGVKATWRLHADRSDAIVKHCYLEQYYRTRGVVTEELPCGYCQAFHRDLSQKFGFRTDYDRTPEGCHFVIHDHR